MEARITKQQSHLTKHKIAGDDVSRSQRLFHFIEKARQSEQIAPQTAKYAWKTWQSLRWALSQTPPVPDTLHDTSARTRPKRGRGSKTEAVPDASCGPDGQFLFIWDKGEHHLELEIEPSGEAYFFYRNRTSGALWDSEYTVGNTLPAEAIEKLRIVI